MFEQKPSSKAKTVLVLNKPFLLTDNDFYVSVFRVPEALSRLRRYRELLSRSGMDIPVWVYCLTQEIRTLMGSPRPSILRFLVSLGLFDRYAARCGRPDYILGSDPLASVIAGETAFEEQALFLTKKDCRESGQQRLLRKAAGSHCGREAGAFRPASLRQMPGPCGLGDIAGSLKSEGEKRGENLVFQFLAPHEPGLEGDFGSCGIAPMHFLERDRGLKWLWPIWQRARISGNARLQRRKMQ